MSKGRLGRYRVHAQQFGARTVLFQDAAARLLDLTPTELESFRLVQHFGPWTASDLVRETGLTRASMSVIVDKLVARGLLTREQDQQDRRRWILRVKADAVAMVNGLYEAHDARMQTLLDDFSDDDFATAMRFFDQLAAELKIAAIEFSERAAEAKGRH